MNSLNQDYPFWIALAHLPRWRVERINQLIVDILHTHQMDFTSFFAMDSVERTMRYALNDKETQDIEAAKLALPNCAFIAEDLLAQGFQMIPINTPEYSPTLKNNLQMKQSPPLLYVKGNVKLLHEQCVAVVGSRNASERGLQFADRIAEKCAREYRVVVSGFAKGVDKQALDSSIKYIGHSIIVLPQGILTFGSGMKKYYKQIVDGDVLVLSTFPPNAGWDVGLAMSRNTIIYGLADEIYVAESDEKGGTWSGVIDGLRKGRKIFVRSPADDERNANNMLIAKGATAVDEHGNLLGASVIVAEAIHLPVETPAPQSLEELLLEYLSRATQPRTAKQIKEELQLVESTKQLIAKLKSISRIKSVKLKNALTFSLERETQEQMGLEL